MPLNRNRGKSIAMNWTGVGQKLAWAVFSLNAILCVLSSPQALAVEPGFCELQMQANITRPIAPASRLSDLPAEYRAEIARHPIHYLSNRTNGGQNLSFYNPYLDPAANRYGSKGETLQSHFLAEILKEVFPKAHDGAPQQVELNVVDSKERRRDTQPTETIEMSILKAANPAGHDITRAQARARFHVPSSMKVLSVYVQSLYLPSLVESWPSILADLREKYFFDLIVISTNSPVSDKISPGPFKEALDQPLSQWIQNPNRPFYGSMVFNDTVGQMPWIHAMANAAVVMGPINFFEPLVVKTPTVIIVNQDVIRGYDENTFLGLANQAVSTGGAQMVYSMDQVAGRAERLAERPPESITLPGLAMSPVGKPAFKALLDSLEIYLRARIKD